MHNSYVIAGIAAAVAFILGAVFSTKVARYFAVVISGVKAEYAKALEEVKALYDADTKALEARVKDIQALYDADIAKLKADLGDANNKVSVLTSVIASTPAPVAAVAPAVIAVASVSTATTRTKAQISADLAATQATEAQLQADLATAVD